MGFLTGFLHHKKSAAKSTVIITVIGIVIFAVLSL